MGQLLKAQDACFMIGNTVFLLERGMRHLSDESRARAQLEVSELLEALDPNRKDPQTTTASELVSLRDTKAELDKARNTQKQARKMLSLRAHRLLSFRAELDNEWTSQV